jgi:transposase
MASIAPSTTPVTTSAPVTVSAVVIGGIDTHKDLHVAAVIDTNGAVLATESFSTTRAGYRALLRWMHGFGDVRQVGVEGTGSYGAGVTRHLAEAGIEVVEVDRPDRSDRRRRGKSDTLDAEQAARAVLAGKRTSTPKAKDGTVESLRVLRLTRASAIRSRTVALQLLRNHIVAAPEELRDQVRNLTRMQLVRTCAAWRPDPVGYHDPVVATRIALKALARRILELNDEIAALDELIDPLVAVLAPRLLAAPGIGVEIAGQLLVTAGDNPQRLRTEAGFAMLCGVSPLPASSGLTQRHRLNRGGDRQANRALHMAVISRMRMDPATKAYVARRTTDGLSKLEIIRCLKRYLAREVYYLLKPAKPTKPKTPRKLTNTA